MSTISAARSTCSIVTPTMTAARSRVAPFRMGVRLSYALMMWSRNVSTTVIPVPNPMNVALRASSAAPTAMRARLIAARSTATGHDQQHLSAALSPYLDLRALVC